MPGIDGLRSEVQDGERRAGACAISFRAPHRRISEPSGSSCSRRQPLALCRPSCVEPLGSMPRSLAIRARSEDATL